MNVVLLNRLHRPIKETNKAVVKRHNQLNPGRSGKCLLLITHLIQSAYPFGSWL